MKKILKNEYLEEKLIPSFAVGCKRVVPSGFQYLKVSRLLFVSKVYTHKIKGSSEGERYYRPRRCRIIY